MCFAIAVGPLLGGALTSSSGQGWRWCFWINLPISGAAGALLLIFYHPQVPRTSSPASLLKIDWVGILLIMVTTTLFLVGLELGGSPAPWHSAGVICLLVFSAVTCTGFVFYEARISERPLLPLNLLRNRSVIAILVIVGVHGFSFISCVYYAPLYFQTVLQGTPLQAGIWQLGSAIPLATITIFSGLWIKRTGKPRIVIQLACALMTLGFGLFISFPSHRNWPKIIIFQIIIALGIGPLFQAPLIAIHTIVRQEDTAVITSVVNLTRTLSSSVGLVAGQTLFNNILMGGSSAPPKERGTAAADILHGLGQMSPEDVTQAFSTMWTLYTCMASISLFASVLIPKNIFISDEPALACKAGTRRELTLVGEPCRLRRKSDQRASEDCVASSGA